MPFLLRRRFVLRPLGQVFEVSLMHANMDDRDVMIDGRDQIDLFTINEKEKEDLPRLTSSSSPSSLPTRV